MHPVAESTKKNEDVANSSFDLCSINLKSEKERMKTFANWPFKFLGPTNPQTLAKLGFFCTRQGDEVQCAFCGLQISNWCRVCDPSLQHEKYSCECDFLRNRECGNIPI